jgi:probable rRNA maturation factor
MILNRQRRIRLAIKPLGVFSERVRRELGFPEESVTICFVSDPTMAGMNRRFRNLQGPTDVLSFPVQGAKALGADRFSWPKQRRSGPYIGDIVISPEAARRYARRGARSLTRELRVLILHGMIHLAGYDHEQDNGEMMRLEGRLRRRLGLC